MSVLETFEELEFLAVVNCLKAKDKPPEWQDKTPVRWITLKGGHHIPIFAGDSDKTAIDRFMDWHHKEHPMGKASVLNKKYGPSRTADGTHDLKELAKHAVDVKRVDRKTKTEKVVKQLQFNERDIDLDKIVSVTSNPAWEAEFIVRYKGFGKRKDGTQGDKILVHRDHSNQQKQQAQEGRFQRIRDAVDQHAGMVALVNPDLKSKAPEDRQSALAVRLIVHTTARVGDTHVDTTHAGITSLRAKHVKVHPDGSVWLEFTGKAGEDWERQVPEDLKGPLLSLIKSRKPNEFIFDKVHADDVRDYLTRKAQKKISPHDIRRYQASRCAVKALAKLPPPQKGETWKALQKRINDAFVVVAKALGHKNAEKDPHLARKTYSDPEIEEAWAQGRLADLAKELRVDLAEKYNRQIREAAALEDARVRPEEEAAIDRWLKRFFQESDWEFVYPKAGDDPKNYVDD